MRTDKTRDNKYSNFIDSLFSKYNSNNNNNILINIFYKRCAMFINFQYRLFKSSGIAIAYNIIIYRIILYCKYPNFY